MLRLARSVLAALLLVLVACSTPPVAPPTVPPPISPVTQALRGYHGVADAPSVLEQLTRALEQTGQDASTLTPADQGLYGNLLLASGQYDRAGQVFEGLLKAQPDNKDALTSLALLAGLQGDGARQKALVDRAAALYPSDTAVLNLQGQNAAAAGDVGTARRAWQASLAVQPTPEALLGLAALSLQAKNPKDALAQLSQAEALTTTNDLLYSLKAQAETATGATLAAERDLGRAIELLPTNAWYWLDRARLGWLSLQKPQQALADTRQALALDPSLFYAWEYQAEILESLGQATEAYQAYRRALALKKDFRFSYPAAATLAFRLRDFSQAVFYAHEAAKDYPGEYAFPVIEALSLRFLGRDDQATTVLQRNVGRFPAGTTVNELYRFLMTPGNDFALNTALAHEAKENIRVRVQFYQGCQYVLFKAYSSARAAFEAASESHLPGIPEIGAARDWLDHGF